MVDPDQCEVFEGVLMSELHTKMPCSKNYSVWLSRPDGMWVIDAAIAGSGSRFLGKRVRITIEALPGEVP